MQYSAGSSATSISISTSDSTAWSSSSIANSQENTCFTRNIRIKMKRTAFSKPPPLSPENHHVIQEVCHKES
jgi:hypothetical protein